jgi:hypothetical protein
MSITRGIFVNKNEQNGGNGDHPDKGSLFSSPVKQQGIATRNALLICTNYSQLEKEAIS